MKHYERSKQFSLHHLPEVDAIFFTVSYLTHYAVILKQLTMENIIDLSTVTVKNTQVQQIRMQKS